MSQEARTEAVAIVSIGALFPGAPTTPDFWRDLVAGQDRLSEVPRTHWLARDYFDPRPGTKDKVYTTRGGFLPELRFNPMEFGIPPTTLTAIDTAQLLALVVAKRVLEEATRLRTVAVDRSRVSVLLGVASATELVAHMSGRLQIPVVEQAMRAAGIEPAVAARVRETLEACYVPWQEDTFPGMLGNVVAGRVANRLDLGGTNVVVDAACASSLAALKLAVEELSLGRADLVITGGVDTLNDILMFMCFAQTGALSRSGDCRPFSSEADGTMLGEGVGLFAVRRLADAERDGDPIYAVVRGVGSSSDGRATSIYAPLPAGQVRALERAYAAAQVSPATVGLVEAHGTGTAAGDAAELEALATVYRRAGARPRRTALGSVKGQIGHTKAAAGAAGLAKIALALHHRVLPPTLKVGTPLGALTDDECPFFASTRLAPWIHGGPHPRRAAVSALGFGGTNFHVVLEEHAGERRPERLKAYAEELLLLSAGDTDALAQACRAAAEELRDPLAIGAVARALAERFAPTAELRLALVVASGVDARERLLRAADALGAAGTPEEPGFGRGAPLGPVAVLFPGQGSQAVGMGRDLAVHFDRARCVWDAAARLPAFLEEPLHTRVFPPPDHRPAVREAQAAALTQTEWAQPALVTASLAAWELLASLALQPLALAGHSLGELSALAAAGALTPLEAIEAARVRGRAMAEAARARPGAMSAVAASRERVERALEGSRPEVVLANHNAPEQVVLSGETGGVLAAEERLRAAGLSCQRLNVSAAFHSPAMDGAVPSFRAALDALSLGAPLVPVVAHADAALHPLDPAALRDRLARGLVEPVRFVDQVDRLYALGARVFLEVGPGEVLGRLVGRCLVGRPHLALSLDAEEDGVRGLLLALARLAAAGVALDYAALGREYAPPPSSGGEAAVKVSVSLSGANHGKPYPAQEERIMRSGAGGPGVPRRGAVEGGAAGAPGGAGDDARRDAPAPGRMARPPARVGAPGNGAGHVATNGNGGDLAARFAAVEVPAAALGAGLPPGPAPNPGALDEAGRGRASTTKLAGGSGAFGPVGPRPPAAASGARADGGPDLAWLAAVRDLQAPLIAAQMEYERGLADAHTAFLRAVEASYAAAGLPPAARGNGLAAGEHAGGSVSSPPASRNGGPAHPTLADALGAAAARELEAERPGPLASGTGQEARPAAVAGDPPAPPPAGPPLMELMLGVVAEKTGYPVEMIDPAMDLESDLGIDSIKRVEILAATRERYPALPEVDPARLGKLRTLGQIAEVLAPAAAAPRPARPDAPAAHAGAAPPGGRAPAGAAVLPPPSSPGLLATLAAIVAEKTGYPPEMIEARMDLESDLGIDSIKRVEILAATRERYPALPAVDPGRLAKLRTLADIVDTLQGAPRVDQPPAPRQEPAPSRAPLPGPVAGPAPRREPAPSPTPLPGPVAGPAPDSAGEDVPRYEVGPAPLAAPGLATPGLFGPGSLAIVGGDEVGRALARALREAGVRGVVEEQVPGDARGLVFLGGLAPALDARSAVEVQRRAFEAAVGFARRGAAGGALFVTVQDTGGDLGASGAAGARAWVGGLAALAKTAALEWPGSTARAIDLQRAGRDDEALARALAAELLRGGADREVGLGADGQRTTLVARPVAALAGESALAEGDLVVISGGARGVTAACALALGRALRPRLSLLGRTPLSPEPAHFAGLEGDAELKRAALEHARRAGAPYRPSDIGREVEQLRAGREIRSTLAELEALGVPARYDVVDVRDATGLARTLEEVRRRFGPVRGLVHGAGVIADALLESRSDAAQFTRVFDTKVSGLHALLAATESDPLKVLCFFASIAARRGNPGQADYAMANEVLHKVAAAERRRRPAGTRVVSLGWGPWEGGMVTPGLAQRFKERGVGLIPLAAGARAFVAELSQGTGEAEVLLGVRGLELAPEPRRAEVWVQEQALPFLADHLIHGTVVLPLVMALEWFARLVRGERSGPFELAELRVRRGVPVPDFGGAGERLTLAFTPGAGALELLDARGGVRFSARLEPADPAAPAARTVPLASGAGAPYGPGSALFHGPSFQVLSAVQVSAAGGSATARGVHALGWPHGPWALDAAALDGALQLALLSASAAGFGPTLPLAVARVRVHAPPAPGELRVEVVARDHTAERAVFDAVLRRAEDGACLAELEGVELYVVPRSAAG